MSVFEGRICFLAYGWYSITLLWINQQLKMGKSWNFIRIGFYSLSAELLENIGFFVNFLK